MVFEDTSISSIRMVHPVQFVAAFGTQPPAPYNMDAPVSASRATVEPGSVEDSLLRLFAVRAAKQPLLSPFTAQRLAMASQVSQQLASTLVYGNFNMVRTKTGRIPRPPNAFILYRQHWHPILKEVNHLLHNNQICGSKFNPFKRGISNG